MVSHGAATQKERRGKVGEGNGEGGRGRERGEDENVGENSHLSRGKLEA